MGSEGELRQFIRISLLNKALYFLKNFDISDMIYFVLNIPDNPEDSFGCLVYMYI